MSNTIHPSNDPLGLGGARKASDFFQALNSFPHKEHLVISPVPLMMSFHTSLYKLRCGLATNRVALVNCTGRNNHHYLMHTQSFFRKQA